jgi:cardiolipin synthase (CMP-forming)
MASAKNWRNKFFENCTGKSKSNAATEFTESTEESQNQHQALWFGFLCELCGYIAFGFRLMPLNIPTLLTWARIVLIPLFVGVLYLPEHWLTIPQQNVVATAIFIAAAITDWLDGWLARKLNQMTAFGAFLDPVADKLMVAAALVVLVQLGRADAIAAFIIIGREITISALREWMAKIGAAKNIAVSFLGKLKTTAQMVAIPMLLFNDYLGPLDMAVIGEWLLNVAVVLTLASMVYYIRKAWPDIVARSK